ncbi:hypothetical protein [Saccharothrix longispora]|uniref:hypothetical protein n=1 Tax=Saccharothrix longispora TaxID=33920 RepID=UPI0028FD9D8E|nr:hypothetical protein [Saccharothrix longispora]MDU0292290.1 hypothetical protein [Saccharothrix longispora]
MNEKQLIAAGAVLPGAIAPGEDRDTVTARHYTHPALDDRVVVRLVPAVLGEVEDLTCEYLGFDAPVRTADVGTGRRSALGFPAWALVNDPANAHHALNLVKDVERLARTAKSRAGAAKDGFTALGDMLGRSAPHFLPTFYEQAGRIFLQHGNTTYAASMFGKAREAEEVHDLAVDPERTREVFLEFAFAGALTAKALSAHAKGLARKHDADAAYELFFTLCVERTRGGLPPYTGMPEDLRRLAKAAKRVLREEDERLLRAVLDSTAIGSAGAGFWKSYRDSLVALALREPDVRARLLEFVPDSTAALDTWFDVLEGCGATGELVAPTSGANPAEWLSGVVKVRTSGWRGVHRSTTLLDLVARMADRLVADGVPVRVLRNWRQGELDLLDLLVERGVPIADVERGGQQLDVGDWVKDEEPGRRDLVALAGSERFGPGLGRGLAAHLRAHARSVTVNRDVLLDALAVPGLRTALRDWLTARAADVTAAGLPDLYRHLDELAPLQVPEAYVDVPGAAETVARTDVAAALHRTLRAGLFDELGWPALEEAVARLLDGGVKDEPIAIAGEGWPALVLSRGDRFVVVGPDGVLAEHVSRIPADRRPTWRGANASWFDGVLLVTWHAEEGELGYWSDAPERVFAVTGKDRHGWRPDVPHPSIALPGGGRFSGSRAVHPGDTSLPQAGDAHGDGTTVWTTDHDVELRWREVDPATGAMGRASRPRFLEDFAEDGARVDLSRCDLRPAAPGTEHSPLGFADGLHGWRVRHEADGSWTGEGVDGRRVRLAKREPVGVLRLPGSEVALTGRGDSVSFEDGDGTVWGTVSAIAQRPPYAMGTPFVPPRDWWHALRPRDEAGSAALRAVTREAVEAMMAAADATKPVAAVDRLAALRRGEHDEYTRAITDALPGLTDPALVVGVCDVVRRAAEVRRSYRRYAEVAEAARGVESTFAPTGPAVTETALLTALDWIGEHWRNSDNRTPTALPEVLAALAAAAADPPRARRALPAIDGEAWFKALPHLPALAYRAASPLTPDDERGPLVQVLRWVAGAGLADAPGRWRVVAVQVPGKHESPHHRLVPVGDGFTALSEVNWSSDGNRYGGLQYSPSGDFALPGDWRLLSSAVVDHGFGAERIARFAELLAERGPAPWSPDAVGALVERTGLSTAEAIVLLAGMPNVARYGNTLLTTEQRRLVGLSPAGAKAGKDRLRRLDRNLRLELLAAAVPADPADLWERGPDVDAVAARWVAEHGLRTPVPDDVLADAVKLLATGGAAEHVAGVIDPERTDWLTRDADLRWKDNSLQAHRRGGFGGHHLGVVAQVLLFLAHRLPAGSPLRAALPRALELARDRTEDPGFAVQIGYYTSADELTALLGIDKPAPGEVVRHRPWLEVCGVNDHYCRLGLRPGLLAVGDGELLAAVLTTTGSTSVLDQLRLLHDDAVTAACAVTAPEGVDPAAYFQDPAVSVPHLVGEVAERFALSEDAAALYLQLLALPDPTDANVARWTGWKPARLKKARTELGATDLVLTAKRARAGRSLFLPGGWLALGAPHLPVESWKAPMFGFTTRPSWVVVPLEPVADLFARAWRRVLDGDAPAYEELKTGGRR